MKFLIFVILFVTSFSVLANTHQCQMFTVIQRYDAATMALKSATEAKSSWFVVTQNEEGDVEWKATVVPRFRCVLSRLCLQKRTNDYRRPPHGSDHVRRLPGMRRGATPRISHR